MIITQQSRATIVGGSNLLTPGFDNQLSSWLGECSLTLTRIYSSEIQAKSPAAFHGAVNNQGRTFSVFEVILDDDNSRHIVGGYNPVSWESLYGGSHGYGACYHVTPNLDAFIFDLSTGNMLRQTGSYQTNNCQDLGPAFGNGFDLSIGYIGGYYPNLSRGHALQRAYGINYINLFGKSGRSNYSYYDVGTIEVFNIQHSTVIPEPGSWLMIISGLFGMGIVTRIRRQK